MPPDVRTVYAYAQKTQEETGGYFNPYRPDGSWDPSGIVKGWAIHEASLLVAQRGVSSFCINAGGDIATGGHNEKDEPWCVGIRHPLQHDMLAKVIYPQGRGVATSGNYRQGHHIYNPHEGRAVETPFVSLTS